MTSSKAADSPAAQDLFDDSQYRENTSANLEIILKRSSWTQKRLAGEMGVAQSMMVEYLRGSRLPSLRSILRLVNSTEIQKLIPFTIDQFLTGDIRDSDDRSDAAFAWNQEESVHKDILGTYLLYLFDQKLYEVGSVPRMRKLRYGVLSLYEVARKSGGVKVLAFARFFKSEADALAFRGELDRVDDAGQERRSAEIALYHSYDDSYAGSVMLIGNHIFVDLFSSLYNDKALIVLTAPDKKPGAEYIGGLGNVLSITHGAEHVPVSQKIILSRGALEASEEEITSHLLFGDVKIEIDGEAKALLQLMELFCSSEEEDAYLGRVLDAADRHAILQQRLRQLINNYMGRTFNGLFLVSKQDDHACYQFLKRQAKQ